MWDMQILVITISMFMLSRVFMSSFFVCALEDYIDPQLFTCELCLDESRVKSGWHQDSCWVSSDFKGNDGWTHLTRKGHFFLLVSLGGTDLFLWNRIRLTGQRIQYSLHWLWKGVSVSDTGTDWDYWHQPRGCVLETRGREGLTVQ